MAKAKDETKNISKNIKKETSIKSKLKKDNKSDIDNEDLKVSSTSKKSKDSNDLKAKKRKVANDLVGEKKIRASKVKSANSKTSKTKSDTSKLKRKSTKKSSTIKKVKAVSTLEDDNNLSTVKSKPFLKPIISEYYDLPYRYNQTIVKILAQNPNTLFAYWDISDEDRLNFENTYGNDFFNVTRPVLVVHNITENYSYEVPIDDFANNWYIHVNDTKCKYSVELGRKPLEKTSEISTDYLNVSYSNTLEMPNDHVIFFKENDSIYFKNIKTNKVVENIFKSKDYENNLKGIYDNYDISEINDKFDFKNPSSQNPTSNVL